MGKSYSSLNFDIDIEGLPSTAAEFDELAKREGACLEHAVNNYVAHSHLTKVRAAICERVEKETGISRKTEEREDDKVIYTETEKQYINRVNAELTKDDESLEEHYIDAIKEAAASVVVDLTKSVRTAGSAKLAQKWIDKAASVIAAGKAETFAEAKGITLSGDEEDDLQAIGSKIRDITAQLQKQALEDAMSI